jgi:malate/lactate dehydrogenase
MGKTVMLCGSGEVGGWVLEFLARSEGVDRLVVFDVKEEIGMPRTYLAAIGSVFQGFSKEFILRMNDVTNIDATAMLLDEFKPDVIFSSVTLQSPRMLMLADIPNDIREKLRQATFGVWLPWHLILISKLIQAVKKSGIQTHVINISFPDVVNPVLWKYFGFGPTVGAGNIEITAALVTKYISIMEKVPVTDVTPYFIGSHAFMTQGPRSGVPHFVKIMLGDKDITQKYDIEWIIHEWPVSLRWGKTAVFSIFAASAVKNIMGILRDSNEYTHAAAPKGLCGGYPVRLSSRGVDIILPQELTLEQAIKINEEGNRFDGIEKIMSDGTVVYTDKTYSIMKELGYDCKQVTFDDLESRCEELKRLYAKLANPMAQ